MASRLVLLLCLLFSIRMQAQTIGPLLKTEWHQYAPYNRLCPTINGERTMVGCVATAATEIMYVYQWPKVTVDSLCGWSTSDYNIADVPPGVPLRWEDILADYGGQYTESQADAVAELSLYAAMACHMNFGTGSSGADSYNYLKTLAPVFDYPYVHMYDRSCYSPSTWRSILIYELSQGHPLFYTGYNQEFSGHAFVIDGYDAATHLFHAGWGYGGAYNGWFDIDVLNPFERQSDPTSWGRREGFFCNHAALAFAPQSCTPFPADSVVLDVTLDSITVPKLYVGSTCEAVFHFTNNTADTLTYTYEVLSNEPQDTALFEQADFVGLSAITLLPYSKASDPVLLRIRKAGSRQLRISCDDVNLSVATAVEISDEPTTCTVGQIELVAIDDTSATFTVPIEGQALLTWCLFPDGSMTTDTDCRHWSLGSDTVTFNDLTPGHEYTLALRQPWTIRDKLVFTTTTTSVMATQSSKDVETIHDLLGRRLVAEPRRGIYIRNGRTVVK